MRFRKLRIAFSVTCGLACVLLIALWVRSYWNADAVKFSRAKLLIVSSISGRLSVLSYSTPISPKQSGWAPGWGYGSFAFDQDYRGSSWSFISESNVTDIGIPHWFAVLVSGACTTLPWLRYRFSLRTLLIATTLVAVVLGLVVWLR
jgi:hypothetical protein